MFKKLAVLCLAVAAGIFLLSSTHFGRHARTAINKAKASVSRAIPIELQLETVKDEVARLIPDMRKQISAIAAETVAVQNLREDVEGLRVAVENKKLSVKAMADKLGKGDVQTVSFRGVDYTVGRFQAKLNSELVSAKTCQESLKSKEMLLEAKSKALAAATEQLASVRAQKDQLEAVIAQMEADLKSLRLAQTKSQILNIDDSRLSQIKGSLNDIRNQMRAQDVERELLGNFDGDLNPTPEKKIKSKDQLQKEVNDFLGETGDSSRVASGNN